MNRRGVSILVCLLGAGVLFGGLGWLIHLRFQAGDGYAVRSSLRTDPLGAKALHEAYAALPDHTAMRNFTPLDQLAELPGDAALLFLNTRGWDLHALGENRVIHDFVKRGGRLVVAMNPDRVAYKYIEEEAESVDGEVDDPEAASPEARKRPRGVAPERRSFTRTPTAAQADFWAGLALRHGEHSGGEARLADGAGAGLPKQVPWREGGVLVEYDAAQWRPLYQIDEEVVGAIRNYGAGDIVVLTDDYLFSNEALLKHRQSDFLSWIAGGKRQVIFEETHLGVAESTGIAVLMRRYRLSGFFAAFAGFMALVVWRGASPLLPPFAGRTRENVVLAEHSTEAGLSDLVRRSVSAAELPGTAFGLWKKSFIRTETDRRYFAAELEAAEAVLAEHRSRSGGAGRAHETHSKIKSIINRKKRRRQ